jgi:hypothetical protein
MLSVFGSPVVPEALTFEIVVLLSSATVVIAIFSFRKRARNLTNKNNVEEKPHNQSHPAPPFFPPAARKNTLFLLFKPKTVKRSQTLSS